MNAYQTRILYRKPCGVYRKTVTCSKKIYFLQEYVYDLYYRILTDFEINELCFPVFELNLRIRALFPRVNRVVIYKMRRFRRIVILLSLNYAFVCFFLNSAKNHIRYVTSLYL